MVRTPIVIALALALPLAGCGGEEPTAREPISSTVCEAAQGEAPDELLAIRGSVIPLSDLGGATHPGSQLGFVLEAEECTILVTAPDRSEVAGLERGRQVTVNGAVGALDELVAERVRRVLDLPSGTEAITDGVPRTPIAPGDPVMSAISVIGP